MEQSKMGKLRAVNTGGESLMGQLAPWCPPGKAMQPSFDPFAEDQKTGGFFHI